MVANISPSLIRFVYIQKIHQSDIIAVQIKTLVSFSEIGLDCKRSLLTQHRLTGWTLLKLFNGFFWSIQIHKGQLEMVKKAASEVSRASYHHEKILLITVLKCSFLVTRLHIVHCPVCVSVQCSGGVPACAQVSHWLSSHHFHTFLSQHKSSTHCSWQQSQHPHLQVRNMIIKTLLCKSTGIIRMVFMFVCLLARWFANWVDSSFAVNWMRHQMERKMFFIELYYMR